MSRRSKTKKVLPSYVFQKISGHKLTPKCIGCGKKFVTTHSAKKYCDDCLGKSQRAEAAKIKADRNARRNIARKVAKKKAAKKSVRKATSKKTAKKATKKKATKKIAKKKANKKKAAKKSSRRRKR